MAEGHPGSDLETRLKTDIPHAARIWNYWLGGKDNFEADRAVGDAVKEAAPSIVTMAKQSRQFLIRVVEFLAGQAGVRQFVDVGTGLPTTENTHEIAQRVAPESKIVYVDNDPIVLVHARALLVNTTPEGVTTYVDGDFHKPEQIIADARNVLNFNEPIAIMFMGVLGYVGDVKEMHSIVDRMMDAVPSGSYLVLWDSAPVSEDVIIAAEKYNESRAVPYNLRTIEELERCFEGLEKVEPGLVPFTHWRPRGSGVVESTYSYGAVARKP